MSGSTSVAVPPGGGGGVKSGYRPPFTAVQWQELEHQALIYKYLVAGVPVPYDLVVPIRRSLEALSARFFHHPALGYCSYYGKKFDPEPGRCRRTDGKKWRCSKDAYPDSKYCERHMHRGRNRSRKPVESQSQSLSSPVSHVTTASGTGGGVGSYQSVSSGNFTNSPLYSAPRSGTIDFGSSVSKARMDASPYGINNNNFRYAQGLTVDVDDQSYSSGASGTVDSPWGLMPTTSLIKSRTPQLNVGAAFEPMATSKLSQQHCLFGSKIGSPVEAKPMRHFFDEWPEPREPWSTTQLSISTAPEYTARTDGTPNDA